MRKSLINSLLSYKDDPKFCVLTGDLGFNALEPLRNALGERFINAGIAEQNMISLAAGLAKMGLRPFVYSISPFIYARAFEQIRNDICFHDLPVCLIGSGAGYGYGNQGPTHHALEDYGTLSTLQNMKIFVPSFASDMAELVNNIINFNHPVYIRLGRDESFTGDNYNRENFAPYRKLKSGFSPSAGVILVIGNMAGSVLHFCRDKNFSVWSCGVLPLEINSIPAGLFDDIKNSYTLFIIEDHVKTGGLGEQFGAVMLESGIIPEKFKILYAHGYANKLYGSQDYYRANNGLNLKELIK